MLTIYKEKTNKSSIAKQCYKINNAIHFTLFKTNAKHISIHEAFQDHTHFEKLVNSKFTILLLSNSWENSISFSVCSSTYNIAYVSGEIVTNILPP